MRLMSVLWEPSEAGAPFILPDFPLGTAARTCEALGISLDVDDLDMESVEFKKFSFETGTSLEVFLQNASLPPGTYSYQNPLVDLEYDEWLLDSYRGKTRKVNKQNIIVFEFNSNHRALLKHANSGWIDYIQCPGIHSKRPYGDCTAFTIDMTEILNIPMAFSVNEEGGKMLDAEIDELMEQIHYQEMQEAMQVFLRHATIELGTYARIRGNTHFWGRKSR